MPLLRRTAEDLDRERAEHEARNERNRVERLKSHALAGAFLFAFAQLAYGLMSGGLNLLGILVMAPCGALLGYLATRKGWGPAEGTGAGFALVALLLGAISFFGGGSLKAVPWIVFGAAISGGIPGCVVGFHVRNAI